MGMKAKVRKKKKEEKKKGKERTRKEEKTAKTVHFCLHSQGRASKCEVS